jgi:hypothetical protein
MNNEIGLYEKWQDRFGRGPALLLGAIPFFLVVVLIFWANYWATGISTSWWKKDFMLIWLAGRGLIEGFDLYDPVSWANLHDLYAHGYRDNPVFFYPLPAAILFSPLAFLPVPWSATIWAFLSEIMVFFSVGYFWQRIKFTRSLVTIFALITAIVLFRPILLTIHLGQYSAVMLALLTAFYASVERRRDWLAGFCLPLLVLRPNPVVVLIPAILLWSVWAKRWKIIFGGALSGIALLGLSWWMRPGWIGVWIQHTVGTGGKMYRFIPQVPTLWGLVIEQMRAFPSSVQTAIIIIVTCLVGLTSFWVLVKKTNFSIGALIAVATSVSLFVTPYSWQYDQILLLFPLLYVLTLIREGDNARNRLAWLGVILLLDVVPYVFLAIAHQRQIDSLSALNSLGVLVLVLWAASEFPERAVEFDKLV